MFPLSPGDCLVSVKGPCVVFSSLTVCLKNWGSGKNLAGN